MYWNLNFTLFNLTDSGNCLHDFTDPSGLSLYISIAPRATPVHMNKICVETIRHIATGTSAYRASCFFPKKNSRVPAIWITLHSMIIFPEIGYLFLSIEYTTGNSRYRNNPHRFVYWTGTFIGCFSNNRFWYKFWTNRIFRKKNNIITHIRNWFFPR